MFKLLVQTTHDTFFRHKEEIAIHELHGCNSYEALEIARRYADAIDNFRGGDYYSYVALQCGKYIKRIK